jgi:hypothetical protein
VHRAGTDAEQSDGQPATEQLVGQPEPVQALDETHVAVFQLDRKVRDEQQQRADHRQDEQRRDLPFGSLGRLRVGIGHPVLMSR